MKSGARHRGEWFWRFRPNGAPACIEQTEDGRWSIIIGRREIAIVASREVAITVVDQLDDAKISGGGDGGT